MTTAGGRSPAPKALSTSRAPESLRRAEIHAAFAVAVRDALSRTGKRQKDVAQAVGKSPVDISRYLSTASRLPRDWPLIESILTAAGADVVAFAAAHGHHWGVHQPLDEHRLATDPSAASRPADPKSHADPEDAASHVDGAKGRTSDADGHADGHADEGSETECGALGVGSSVPRQRTDSAPTRADTYTADTGHVLDEPVPAAETVAGAVDATVAVPETATSIPTTTPAAGIPAAGAAVSVVKRRGPAVFIESGPGGEPC